MPKYDRQVAVSYAHRWATGRNPAYYNFDAIGGDCTNFVSQCIYAGSRVMDYTRDLGWYYISANDKSPSWTGVRYLWQFMSGKTNRPGPFGYETDLRGVTPGDFVQISFDGEVFVHSLIVVDTSVSGEASDILIAAHSFDCDYRPLSTYEYRSARFLHIAGVRE